MKQERYIMNKRAKLLVKVREEKGLEVCRIISVNSLTMSSVWCSSEVQTKYDFLRKYTFQCQHAISQKLQMLTLG